MKPLRITVAAEKELYQATAWYRDRDPRVARRFTAHTSEALHLIQQFPSMGGRVPGVDDANVRQVPIRKFPYQIVFVDLGDTIEVVAFAHNRRRPAYFLKRLEQREPR